MAWHPETERWQTPLGRFVREYGVQNGSAALAGQLDVTPQAVYRWVAGRAHPRFDLARQLVAIAVDFGAQLTIEDVYVSSAERSEGNWVTEWAASR